MMKLTCAGAVIPILVGLHIITSWHHPRPVVAAVEITPGVVAKSDQAVMDGIVAAFDRAESAVQKADLESLLAFYSTAYNYHGLKHGDVRRVWDEVFMHYREITSKHVFTVLKVTQVSGVIKASVTCTGGLYGTDKQTGKPITIDSWVNEVHFLVKEKGTWKFLGNAGGRAPAAPPASAPHHPLF